MNPRDRIFHDAPDGGGGGAATVDARMMEVTDQLAAVVSTIKSQAENFGKMQEQIDSLRTAVSDGEIKAAAQLADMRNLMANKHGKSGAQDFFREVHKFMCGVYHIKHPELALTDELKLSNGAEYQKAAYTTTTGATAGYLVPDFLMPDLLEIAQIHGSIYPDLLKGPMPPGSTLKVNRAATNPTASFRVTQATDMQESQATVGQDEITTVLTGCYGLMANELLQQPGVGWADKSAMLMVEAIFRTIETGVLAADHTGSGATDPPSDGIINDASTHQVGAAAITGATVAALISYLEDCVDNWEGAVDTTKFKLVLSPAKWMALAGDTAGTALSGILNWGDPVKGIPPTFMGYPIFPHPGAKVSTTHYLIHMNPGGIVLGESGSFSIDINPFEDFQGNVSGLRVFTHCDWSLGQASQHSYRDFA